MRTTMCLKEVRIEQGTKTVVVEVPIIGERVGIGLPVETHRYMRKHGLKLALPSGVFADGHSQAPTPQRIGPPTEDEMARLPMWFGGNGTDTSDAWAHRRHLKQRGSME
ncbi:MAG: hypothetical protein AAF583_08070 [Pseudomonadota bacterium]